MLGVGHVHVADDVHDAAVGLFGQAFVLTAVAGFHVENRDMQTLSANSRKAAVGVAENQQGVGLAGDHEFVAAIDDVTHGCAEVVVEPQRTMAQFNLHSQHQQNFIGNV